MTYNGEIETVILPKNIIMFWKNNIMKEEDSGVLTSNISIENEVIEEGYTDYKTSRGIVDIDYIDLFKGELIAYLFIEKNNVEGHYSLISPVIREKLSGQYIRFGTESFALQGGEGKRYTRSLLLKLKKYEQERNFFVPIVLKVIESKLINDFEYMESKLTLDDMINNSENILNYRQTDRLKMLFDNYILMRTEVDLPKPCIDK